MIRDNKQYRTIESKDMEVKRWKLLFSPLIILLLFVACKQDDNKNATSLSIQRHLEDYESPDHQWGFMNNQGEPTIKARFDDVRPFAEGLAAVNENGLWGYINKSGEWVIEPVFIKAHNFQMGVARIRGSNGQMGLISMQGDTVLLPIFDEIYNSPGRYLITEKNHKKGLINHQGKTLFDNKYEDFKIIGPNLFGVKMNDYYTLVRSSDNVLQQDILKIKKDGILKTDSGWGAVDSLGQWLIHPNKTSIAAGHLHHFIINDASGWHLFNTRDKVNRATVATRIRYLGESRYAIKSDEGWQLADDFLRPLNQMLFESVYNFSEGLAAIEIGGYWGYIDITGKLLIEPVFVLPWQSKEGKIRFFTRSGFGFLDHNGNIIIQPDYEDVRDFSEGMAAYLTN